MKKAHIDYFKALDLLLASCYSLELEENRIEYAASLTHWLQNVNSKPILLEESLTHSWYEILSHYSGIINNHLNIDKFIKNSVPQIKPIIKYDNIPFQPPSKAKFTFIDLFAGIGGFRIALQNCGGKCVFSCEMDNNAKNTYFKNFGEVPFGDVRQFTGADIPDEELDKLIPNHHILAAGFPCQPFSRAGISARNSLGQLSGFECEIQGTLFFDIARIAKVKKPDVLFLENVRHLENHDGERTISTIKAVIDSLGYDFNPKVIDSSTVVPQRRKRFYIVCFKKKKYKSHKFNYPEFKGKTLPLKTILETDVSDEYTISDKLWKGHVERTKRNIDRGTGFTAFEADLEKPSNTIVARYGKDGKECLIPQQDKNPRYLTPRECARLQGFPDNFKLADSKTAAYRQFGNAVTVPVVQKIAEKIVSELSNK